jgi:hypothetical protein
VSPALENSGISIGLTHVWLLLVIWKRLSFFFFPSLLFHGLKMRAGQVKKISASSYLIFISVIVLILFINI